MVEAMKRLLVLYCGAGGDSTGYSRVGFKPTGVDVKPQPHYPFDFVQGDAFELGREMLMSGDFDAVVGSPPCYAHSALRTTYKTENQTGWMVAATREMFQASGLPWIIENVPGAPLRNPLVLCGSMFGLGAECQDGWRQLRRHRLFESNVPLTPPGECKHERRAISVHGGGPAKRKPGAGRGGYQGLKHEKAEAMGIDWMIANELSRAVPPAYAMWIGTQLREHLDK